MSILLDPAKNQATLEALRAVQRRLYAIPVKEVSTMKQADQVAYASALHQCGLAILKLETAALQGINDAFQAREQALATATARLAKKAATLADAVALIRGLQSGLATVTTIIKLLG
jgi:hypothetical protein